jgi:DNA-binding NarL/FixJ family response regulator/signal transduction histidine kinase
LVNRHEVDDILHALLPKISDLLAAPDVSIDLLEDEMTLVTYAATPGQPLQKGDTMRHGEGGWLSWQAIETGQVASLEDYSSWAQRRRLHEGHPIHAIAIIPIHQRERVIGAINFSRREADQPFNETDFYIAQELAQMVALVLDNAQLYSQLQTELAERKQAEATLRQTQTQLIDQQRAMATLEERERLARELHDGLGQILGYVNIQSQVIQRSLEAGKYETAAELLVRLTEVSQEAHLDLRNYLSGLKSDASAPRQDFFAALHQYCQHLRQTYGFIVNLHLPTDPPEMLASTVVETQLTYIIREALSNARRYSGVLEASLIITFDETNLQAVMEDMGIGMEKAYTGPERRKGAHFGLGIMRERAEQVGGSLRIETAPNAGMRIIARLPRKLASEEIPPLRILLVDDHPLFLEGLSNLLSIHGMQVVGTAGDGLEAQVQARKLHPDLIVMDVQMPRCNGLEATQRIKLELPETKIIMLSTSNEEGNLFEALRNGASGYLLKGMVAEEFLAMLGSLARGESVFSPGLASKMLESFALNPTKASEISKTIPITERPTGLTERQIDILRLVSQGLPYKEIGTQLFLTERTIKYHMGEILARLQLKNRREAADYAQSKGLT